MLNSNLINEIPTLDWQKIIGKITQKLAHKFGYQDIDDLNQEAWLVLYHAANKYDPKQNTKFTTFASTCIFRHLFKYLTKKHDNPVEEFNIVDENNDDSKLREKLLDLMNEEPLLKAYFLDNKTYQQIAHETNQYPGSAYKNVQLALKRARTKLLEDD